METARTSNVPDDPVLRLNIWPSEVASLRTHAQALFASMRQVGGILLSAVAEDLLATRAEAHEDSSLLHRHAEEAFDVA